MSRIKNNNKHLIYREYEPPAKKIISEGDVFIKKLANKQQRKDINLKEYLDKKQNFEKVSEQISFTSCSGTLPLQRFKMAVKQLDQMEDLKACNLTNEDIKLILDYKNNGTIDAHRNIEPNVLQSRIERIESIIKECNQKEKFNCIEESQTITHKQNEALALKPNSIETKLLKFALENENASCTHLPHPMDNIKLLEADLFSYLNEEKLKPSKVQKQIRRCANKLNSIPTSIDMEPKQVKISNHNFVNKSKWDQQIIEPITSTLAKIGKVYNCKQQNYYTIKNGEIIKYSKDNSTKNIEIETTRRLTIDEIKVIPKFKDYTPGLPSNTLYLKNLPKQIKDTDLDIIFSKFTSNNTILFKIMGGKMRGQAFATFPAIDIAAEALNAVNGTNINGKPVVIEFGRG